MPELFRCPCPSSPFGCEVNFLQTSLPYFVCSTIQEDTLFFRTHSKFGFLNSGFKTQGKFDLGHAKAILGSAWCACGLSEVPFHKQYSLSCWIVLYHHHNHHHIIFITIVVVVAIIMVNIRIQLHHVESLHLYYSEWAGSEVSFFCTVGDYILLSHSLEAGVSFCQTTSSLFWGSVVLPHRHRSIYRSFRCGPSHVSPLYWAFV